MIKKLGIAAVLGVSALALVACGQNANKDNNANGQPSSMTDKVQQSGQSAKDSMGNAMNKAGDKMKDAGNSMMNKSDSNAKPSDASGSADANQ